LFFEADRARQFLQCNKPLTAFAGTSTEFNLVYGFLTRVEHSRADPSEGDAVIRRLRKIGHLAPCAAARGQGAATSPVTSAEGSDGQRGRHIVAHHIWNFSSRTLLRYWGDRGRIAMQVKVSKVSGRLVVFALSTTLAVGSLGLARADQPGSDWMPAQQVIETVLKSGYTQVTKIEADDGHWEGEGVKNGQKMEFHADPKTGAIIREKPDH
jgi:hypothetical protein